MKFVIVFVGFFGISFAATLRDQDYIQADTLRQASDVHPEGYNFGFETSNGILRSEKGFLRNIGTEDEELVVEGSYQYTGDDGQVYTVEFIADKNGFQPRGAHIPVAKY